MRNGVRRMEFNMIHTNLTVLNLEKSMAFYEKALGLKEVHRKTAPDGAYILVFLSDGRGGHELELTWLADRTTPYDLGDNEIHIGFRVDDYDAAHQMHQEMGCICFENPGLGVYFIHDPDDYWMEIIPKR